MIISNSATVHTYYEPVETINQDEQLRQIDLCRQSWERHGWNLVVIDSKYARRHPWFELYSLGVQAAPTVNDQSYETHCFLRWLSMAEAGGGLMIDYDVVNMGASPSYFQKNSLLTMYQQHVPSVVCGTAEKYLAVCKKFFQFAVNRTHTVLIDGRPHTSDMIMLQKGFTEKEVKKLNVVGDYNSKCQLVHCSNNSVQSFGVTKVQAMQELLERA